MDRSIVWLEVTELYEDPLNPGVEATIDGVAPEIREGSVMNRIRDLVSDIRDFEGTEFASLNYMTFQVYIDGLDFTVVSDAEIQSLFFAAAYAADKENNPEYLRHLEKTLVRRGRPYDRRFVYSKAMRLLDHKKRYDMALSISPLVGYRAIRNRVFAGELDGVLRLDILDTDTKLLDDILGRNDERGIITLISIVIAGVGRLSDATLLRISIRLLDIDSTRFDLALLHLTELYTPESITKKFQRFQISHQDGGALDFRARLANQLLTRIEAISAIRENRWDAFLKPLMEISSPEKYATIRLLVPTDGAHDDVVTLYPNTAINKLNLKQQNAMRGEGLPPTVGIFRVLWSIEDAAEMKKLTLVAHETITTNLEMLANDIATNITSAPTRITFATEILMILVDTIASIYAYYHYTKDVEVFHIIARIRALESRLEWMISGYQISGKTPTPMLSHNGEKPQWSTPELYQQAKTSILEISLDTIPADGLAWLVASWNHIIQAAGGAVEWLTDVWIKELITILERRYKSELKKVFQEAWKPDDGTIDKVLFSTKDGVIWAIGSIGFQSTPNNKQEKVDEYHELATRGELIHLLDLLEILNILEVRYISALRY